MTLDMYFGSLAVATLPNTLSLITFVGLMVLGGMLLNALAWLYTWLYNAMVKAKLNNTDAKIDILLTKRWEEAVALSTVDALHARLSLMDDVYMGDMEFLGFEEAAAIDRAAIDRAIDKWQAWVDAMEADWLDSIRCRDCGVECAYGDECDCDCDMGLIDPMDAPPLDLVKAIQFRDLHAF